tara:strand:- start:30668 stop:30985 length:318 start_codon:yes stop_codon:yes gene_type:complete
MSDYYTYMDNILTLFSKKYPHIIYDDYEKTLLLHGEKVVNSLTLPLVMDDIIEIFDFMVEEGYLLEKREFRLLLTMAVNTEDIIGPVIKMLENKPTASNFSNCNY